MNTINDELKNNPFVGEWLEALGKMEEKNPAYKEQLDYFCNLGMRRINALFRGFIKPKVIFVGTDFPLEIASTICPDAFYVLGGSHVLASQADNDMPKDSDAESKSILAYLTEEKWNIAENAMIVIPMVNDSLRKLSYILSASHDVVSFEVPSQRNSPEDFEIWNNEMHRVIHTICRKEHTLLFSWKLKKNCRIFNESRILMQALEQCNGFLGEDSRLTSDAVLYIKESFLYAKDKEEWNEHLQRLVDELNEGRKVSVKPSRPEILLLGSSVIAPTYKIPAVFDELEINIRKCIGSLSAVFDPACLKLNGKLKTTLIRRYYENNISNAFISNDFFTKKVVEEMELHKVDGIVFLIIKGQTGWDFDMKKIERLLEQKNIPIFRIETDYNYQDVEQLKIRIEAFGEMLRHRKAMVTEKL